MSRKPTILQKTLSVGLMVTVGGFSTLVPTSVLAQTAPKASGELSVNGSATINGTAAISGATVFSESVLKTTGKSGVTVNLGKLGRVELGPDSEMTVRFADGTVGGNLALGRAVVSTPAGVGVSVATKNGVAAADGRLASSMIVDVTCPGATRVAASKGEAKVTTGSKVESVAAGSEVTVSQAAQAPRCARLQMATFYDKMSSGAIAALIIAGVGGAVAGIVAASQSDDVEPTAIVVSGFRP